MTFYNYMNVVQLLLLVVIYFAGINDSKNLEYLSNPTMEMYNKFQYIKTFQEDNGDIIDCIDIYKQPALNHPLIKGHQIQLKPSNIPKIMITKQSKNTSFKGFLKMSVCPNGYVPIKRISNDDQTMKKDLKDLTTSNSVNIFNAYVEYKQKNYGAKGEINVWGVPNVSRNQMSSAFVRIAEGPKTINSIAAGWMVYPNLSNDNRTRLFIYKGVTGHTDDYCYNTLCSDFIQISSKVFPGLVIEPLSIYNGQQYELEIHIFQDTTTGNWWISYENETIGYWPKSVFSLLQDGAGYVTWGGMVYSPSNIPSPQMGSGFKPSKHNTKRTAYIREIKVVRDGHYYDPIDYSVEVINDKRCYNIRYSHQEFYWGYHVLYGGPGGCT